MKSTVCQSGSRGVTQALGRKLGAALDRAGTILLEGELGSGKTTFVQGVAEGFGISTAITSPTFVLLNLYSIPKHPLLRQLVHIDLYRLTAAASLQHLDLAQYQSDPHTVMIVEWPERAAELWKNILGTITFEADDFNTRKITTTGLLRNWLC